MLKLKPTPDEYLTLGKDSKFKDMSNVIDLTGFAATSFTDIVQEQAFCAKMLPVSLPRL